MKNKVMFDISENINTIGNNVSLAKSLVNYMEGGLAENIGYNGNDILNLVGLIKDKLESLEKKFDLLDDVDF